MRATTTTNKKSKEAKSESVQRASQIMSEVSRDLGSRMKRAPRGADQQTALSPSEINMLIGEHPLMQEMNFKVNVMKESVEKVIAKF